MLLVNINISTYGETTPISTREQWERILRRADLESLPLWQIDARRRIHDAVVGKLTFDERGAWLLVWLPDWAASNAGMAIMTGQTEQSMRLVAVALTARGHQFLERVVMGTPLTGDN